MQYFNFYLLKINLIKSTRFTVDKYSNSLYMINKVQNLVSVYEKCVIEID